MTREHRVRLVVYRGLYDTAPAPVVSSWGRLVAALSTRRVLWSKEAVPGWSPVVMREGASRRLDAVLEIDALVLDYDGTASIDSAREAWAPWAHAGHSTWQGPPRCRVVVPLAHPCPAALWPRVYAWAAARDDRIDTSTRDASRLWYVPATRRDTPFAAWEHDGPPLALDYPGLPDPSRPRPPPPRPTRGAGARRCAVRRLDDPTVRERAAAYLRVGVNAAGHAKGAHCPKCGRRSVWWSVNRGGPALCNHERSCGWVGSLARVLDLADAEVRP